ncbi:MAG: hypothetical protein IT429_22430 [Gemmataceae bacterium]|nr:hypothetical protein [Gemmataceae bacterium]
MIRFRCDHCNKLLAVPDGKAGAAGTCPSCKGTFRVPAGPLAEEPAQQPKPSRPKPPPLQTVPGEDDEAAAPEPGAGGGTAFQFSRSGLRRALLWFLCFQLVSLAVGVGCLIAFVFVLVHEPVSFKMILALVMGGGVAFVGLGYFFVALPNYRLFFFSTIPSSDHYLVMRDRLQRFSCGGELVEEVPFANILEVRLITRRNEENPEVTARILGIDLRNLDSRATTLDPQFCRWSQKTQDYDLALIEDFFEVPVKQVYRKIKKRWELWQQTHPRETDEAEEAPARRRKRLSWYQQPLTYVFGVLGLVGLGGLIWLLAFLLGRRDGGQPPVAGLEPGPRPGPEPVVKLPLEQKGVPEASGPRSLPGLLAYWPLDEAQGKAVADASGKGSQGRIEGGAWVPGVKGSALRLDGKRDFVDLGTEPRLNFGPGTPFTVAGWVATESQDGVISSFRRRGMLFPIIELSVRKGSLFGWVRDDTSGFGGAKATGGPVNDGKWHHVALLRQADGTIELFLDGVSQGRDQGKSSGGPITTDLRGLGCDRLLRDVGKKAPGYLAASFDEFCVYDRPLAAAEVTALATRKQ